MNTTASWQWRGVLQKDAVSGTTRPKPSKTVSWGRTSASPTRVLTRAFTHTSQTPALPNTSVTDMCGLLNDFGEDTSRLVGEKMAVRVKIHPSSAGSACGTTNLRSVTLPITYAVDA